MSWKSLLLVVISAGTMLAQDPPARVGRISYVTGAVSFQPAGVDDWAPATRNRPLTVGDQLYTDAGARAEVHIPGTAYRLSAQTVFGFENLDDQQSQARVSEGALSVRVRRLEGNLEVDTPNLAFTITRPGMYRIETDPNNYQTYVTVREGEGQITANGGTFAVERGQQAVVSGQNGDQYNIYAAPGADDFENWVLTRDRREERVRSARYVSPDVVGYEDLDEYGDWQHVPEYGDCWRPRNVPADWAPYHDGHWAWVDPWGWSWVDDSPWGFAPFHYGRWAYIGGSWGWVPGPVRVAPVYAPALVAWVGFGGVSVGVSAGPSVGWFPLGPRDVYIPAYGASREYVNRVNVTNTTVINTTNVTNVYNTYVQTKTISTTNYVNRNVPGAFVAVPQNALTEARPVQQAAIRVQASQLSAIRSAEPAPRVAPQRASVLGHSGAVQAARPAATVLSRPVVAKVSPPPPPPPFQARQQMLAKDPGRPLPVQQLRQIAQQPATPAPSQPRVKVVAQAKPVKPPVVNAPAPKPGAMPQNAARNAQQPTQGGAAPAVQPPNAPGAAQQQRAQQPLPQGPSQRATPAQAPRPQEHPAPPPNPVRPSPQPPRQPAPQPPQPQRPAPQASRPGQAPTPVPQTRPQEATPPRPPEGTRNRTVTPPPPPPRPTPPANRPAPPRTPEENRNRTTTPPPPQPRPAPPASRPAPQEPTARPTAPPEQRRAAPPPQERKASPPPPPERKAPPAPRKEEKAPPRKNDEKKNQ